MPQEQTPKYVTTADGRRITYARWKYEQTIQQEATLKRVNDLITNEATNAVAAGAGLGQQEYGAFLRDLIVPNLLDKYGQINATAAIQFYDESRTVWNELYGSTYQAGRDARRTAATRFATARTQGALQVAQGYAAKYANDYDVIGKTDAVVNWAMKVRAQSGHAPSVAAMNNALTREVAMYHRDTVLFNSALDPYATRVQRVAQATACEFCRLMALGSTNGKVRLSTYAAKYHDNCHCTIQPLFGNDQPVRPDYYDKFEKEYAAASKSGGSAKSILKTWRGLGKIEQQTILTKIAPKTLVNNFADSVAAAKSNAEIQDLLMAKHGKQVLFTGLDRKDLHMPSVKEVATTLDKLIEQFPDSVLKNVRVAPTGKAFAWVRSKRIVGTDQVKASDIEIGPGNLKNPTKLQEAIKRSVEAGHFREADAGAWEDILTHEFGHVIDNSLKVPFNPNSIRDAYLTEKVGKAVSREANDLLNQEVSKYARTNRHELIAEAFADVSVGKNPSELNKRIYEGLLAAYKGQK